MKNALLSLATAVETTLVPPPSPDLSQKKRKRKTIGGGRPKAKKKPRGPQELKSYAHDSKVIHLQQIRAGAQAIVSRLSTVWLPASVQAEYKQSALDGQLLTRTLSFVPGQTSNPFASLLEASTVYVQQSAFG